MILLDTPLPLEGKGPGEPISRAEQLCLDFMKFHKANPHVWELFKSFAFQVIKAGFTHYAIESIANQIRWHTDVVTRGDAVKLNNNYKSFYARLFHLTFPEHDGFFRNRRLVSLSKPAYEHDIKVFDSGPPIGEGRLTEMLTKLLQSNKGAPCQESTK